MTGISGDSARARLRGEERAAPELVDLEVTSALRGLLRVGKVDARRAREALADLRDLSLRRASHRELLTRCWDLRNNLTAYDVSYVALAELLGTTLVPLLHVFLGRRRSCVRLKCCQERSNCCDVIRSS